MSVEEFDCPHPHSGVGMHGAVTAGYDFADPTAGLLPEEIVYIVRLSKDFGADLSVIKKDARARDRLARRADWGITTAHQTARSSRLFLYDVPSGFGKPNIVLTPLVVRPQRIFPSAIAKIDCIQPIPEDAEGLLCIEHTPRQDSAKSTPFGGERSANSWHACKMTYPQK